MLHFLNHVVEWDLCAEADGSMRGKLLLSGPSLSGAILLLALIAVIAIAAIPALAQKSSVEKLWEDPILKESGSNRLLRSTALAQPSEFPSKTQAPLQQLDQIERQSLSASKGSAEKPPKIAPSHRAVPAGSSVSTINFVYHAPVHHR